jgi:hypothetical protein
MVLSKREHHFNNEFTLNLSLSLSYLNFIVVKQVVSLLETITARISAYITEKEFFSFSWAMNAMCAALHSRRRAILATSITSPSPSLN